MTSKMQVCVQILGYVFESFVDAKLYAEEEFWFYDGFWDFFFCVVEWTLVYFYI